MLSPDVIAIHLSALEGEDAEKETKTLKEQWDADVAPPARQTRLPPPRLVCLQSRYRKFLDPLLRFLELVKQEHPGRMVAVVIPELIKNHWWQHVLHSRRARRLRIALLQKGGARVVVIGVPWYLESDVDETPR
jgi:hypothetical protein